MHSYSDTDIDPSFFFQVKHDVYVIVKSGKDPFSFSDKPNSFTYESDRQLISP